MCILGLGHVYIAGMPPKKKTELRAEETEAGGEAEFSVSSPTASTVSARSCASLTSDQLEQILVANQKAMLEANHRSMTALLASLPPIAAAGSESSRRTHIKIPKWCDEEVPSEYFTKFEKALKHNGVPEASWGQLLPVYLAGKAQAAFAQVDPEALDDYQAVKDTLLESLGDTPASADRKWWSLFRQSGEEAGAFYLRIRATGIRRLHGLASREEILEKVILSRFLSLLPSDCYSFVATKEPKNGLQAAKLVQEWEETRSSQRRRPWRQDTNHHSSKYHRRENEMGGGGSEGVSSGVSPKDVVVSQIPSVSVAGSAGSRNVKSDKPRKPIVCYGCGEQGHIRPNCPNKIRSVRSPVKDVMVVDGWLAGEAVSGLKVDTGADRSIVSAEFVPKSAFLKKTVILDSWRGKQFSKHRVAKLRLKVVDTEVVGEFAVAESLDCPALLGNDLGSAMKVRLLSLMLDRAKSDCEKDVVPMQIDEVVDSAEVDSVRATRAQSRKDQKEDEEHEIASAQSGCDPLPLSDIFDFSDEFFEQDPLPIPIEECPSLDDGCVEVV